jgi:hypothetical protein
MDKTWGMTKKQKPKAEPKAKAQTRSRALVPRSEHPAKQAMRELLAARQEDRAARQVMAEQIAELKALVISGQMPVLPTAIADCTRMLTILQAMHVTGELDENQFYNRSDLKRVGGILLVDADALRVDYPNFNEAVFEFYRIKAAKPRKKDRAQLKLLSQKTGN